MNWYYSEKLKKYVSLRPLQNESRIINIAHKLGVNLQWDEFGSINNISFKEAKALVKAAGYTILSPKDYWILYKEAAETDNKELLKSLCSDYFTEMLDRVYINEESYIDHPEICDDGEFIGKIISEKIEQGRPGWITPDDINLNTGHPFRIREKGSNSDVFKYWSPYMEASAKKMCFPIRGYVTSCASISLDLGIPIETRQPKMMIRVCSETPPESFFSDDEINAINNVFKSDNTEKLYSFSNSGLFEKIKASDSPEALRIKEKLYLLLGEDILKSGKTVDSIIKYSDFADYVKQSKQELLTAIKEKKNIVLVTGHKNPDSDTVISSSFEAYRFTLNNTHEDTVFLPFVQSSYIPDEICSILGDDISDGLISETDINISELIQNGNVRFIFTDQNYQQEIQKYVICITDHHELTDSLKSKEFAYSCYIELAGSCTSLIARKYLGQNLDFDRKLSKMLYSAMLMDTECRVEHKMTENDYLIMNFFAQRCSDISDRELYSQLMYRLVSEKNVVRLYKRDYKSYRRFGFATLKVTDIFENNSFDSFIDQAYRLADCDNKNNNFYFTLVKIAQYSNDGITVRKERFYYVWNSNAFSELKTEVRSKITDTIKNVFPSAAVINEEEYTEISGAGKQISRKQIAPALESLVIKLTEFVYFKSIKKWVSRDFLMNSPSVKKLLPDAQTDKNGYVCNITFAEAKKLASAKGFSLLSLPEFWKVYHEAEKMKDADLIESMNCGGFIEFIDTVSVNGKLINHPIIENGRYIGKEKEYNVITAVPGLINTDDIDDESGLPCRVFKPSEDDKSLWRYWSPPEEGTYIFSRSHIFLIGQTCLDSKMLPEEAFLNLGIRPVADERTPFTDISE